MEKLPLEQPKSLQDDALRLSKLDQQVLQAVMEGDFHALMATLPLYLDLRGSLKSRLLDEAAISVESEDAKAVVRKLACGARLSSDGVLQQFLACLGENLNLSEISEDEVEKLGQELFYSWYSHHEYIAGLADLRPLVLRDVAPPSIANLIRQAKQCYAFQQFDAAYSLCRIVIEASVRDICIRKALLRPIKGSVRPTEHYSWRVQRDLVASGPLRERLAILYAELSAAIHGRKLVTKEDARNAFEESLVVIELLYAEHDL